MNTYKADLHIHTVLSPCGDLDASPARMIAAAKQCGVDILGISDHNTTRHVSIMMSLGKENGIFVLPGIEINTKEEIHCLAFFENAHVAAKFQMFIDQNLPLIANDPALFGQQLVVDRDENIIDEVEVSLTAAINSSIYDVSEEVYKLNGIFIPAHIDRPYTSVYSQLGFLPEDLCFDALEVSARMKVSDFRNQHAELEKYTLITNSDAHHPDAINRATTNFELEKISFGEIKKALHNEGGRKTIC